MRKEENAFLISSIPHYFHETLHRFICGSLAVLMVAASVLPNKQVHAYTYQTADSTETSESQSADYPTTEDTDFDISKVEIVGEVEDLRTVDTKTFLKEDGTYVTALYGEPVHYLSDGKYLDIDNTLSFDSKANTYTTKANSFGVRFPGSLDSGKQIQLTYGDYSIGWTFADVSKSSSLTEADMKSSDDPKVLTKINQSVTYFSILDGVDVEYIVTGNSVKENILLSQYIEDFSLSFTYSLGNLSLVLGEDGTYSFSDENGKEVFNFSSLYMFDAEGNDSQNIKMTVKENAKGEYLVTIIPDSEWLKTASYPVTIDPTIYNPYYNITFEDTYVWEQYPTTQSYYNYSYFYVAYNTVDLRRMHGLLKFTLPSMTGKTLTYSHLTLFKYDTGTTTRTIELHQNTSTFSENTVTWNTAPAYESAMIDYKVVNGVVDTAYVFDITESVREWAEGSSTNYGFTIMDKEDIGNFTRFYSSESAVEYPVVEIGFVDSTGIKDFWTYSSQDAGEAGTGYVSDYTGFLTWTREDLSYSSERGSFGLTMVYNITNRTSNIGYGLGWQTNYNMKVVFDTMVGKYYMVDATGSKNYFYVCGYITGPNSTNYPDALTDLIGADEHGTCYEAEDGSGRILMVRYNSSNAVLGIYLWNTDFSLYCFTTIVSNVYYLQYLKSNLSSDNPYVLTITRDATYPDRVTMIKDNVGSVTGQGNYISIVYSSGRMYSATLYLLTDSSPTYNPVQREYYYYSYCSSVTNYGMYLTSQYKNYNGDTTLSLVRTLNYTYDTYGRMTSGYATGGEKIAYTIDSSTDRVTSISSYYSSSIFSTVSYAYGLRTTTITDEEGNFIISKFDDYGHTVNLLDSQGTCQSFVYLNIFKDGNDETGILKHADGSPNYDNNHHLAYSSDAMPTFTNPLGNPNFEVPYAVGGAWTLTNGGGGTAADSTSSPTPQAGNYCVKITTTSAATTFLSQSVVLDAGTYTISGYIYLDPYFSGDSTDAFISFVPNNNVYGSGSGTTETKGLWVLVSEYFVVEADNTTVEIRLGNQGIGSVSFDSIQLTSGFISTSGNLVENPSFEDSAMTGWGTVEAGVSRVANTYDSNAFASILGTYGIRIVGVGVGVGVNGDPTVLPSQPILSSAFGSSEGTLIVGGWAKSDGAPMTTQTGDAFPRYFRIAIYFNKLSVDHDDIPDKVVDFDSGIEGWQYNFISIPFDESITSVLVQLEYFGEGTVYFDNIQTCVKSVMTGYTYDPEGRTLSITKPGNETVISYVETTGNGLFSRIPTSITENGMTTDVSSDAEVINSVTKNNVVSTPAYTDEGQTSSLAVGTDSTTYYTTSTSYLASAFNQYLSSSTDEYGNTTNYYSDVVTGLLEAIENASGQDTHYLYDEKGNLVEVLSVDDYTSATPVIAGKVAYAYDSCNRLVKICLEYSDPASPTYFYEITYDDAGRMSSVKVNSVALMTYAYGDGATYHSGNISTQTYANGDSMQFVYDAFDRVIEIDFWDGSAYVKHFTYEYDLFGQLDVYTEWNSGNVLHQEFYIYDGDGRIIDITDEDGNKTKYEYDDLGNVSRLTFVIDGIENITEYSYDSQSRISSTDFETLAQNLLSRDYDYSDTLALERLNNIVLVINNLSAGLYTKHYGYQGNTTRINQITYDLWSDGGGDPDAAEYQYVYSYDELGNITQISYFESNDLIRQDNYEYDEMNQLIVEDIFQELGNDFTYVYTYDSRGNRTSFSQYGYQRDGLDPADYTLSYEYSQTWLDQLTGNDIIINGLSETQDYAYDAQGNPTDITNFYYFDGTSGEYYDHATLYWEGRQLLSIEIYDLDDQEESLLVSTISYTYNDQGYRTSKTISEPGQTAIVTTYDLLGSQVIHESNGTNDIYYTYDSDGSLISFNLDGEDYFCINNLQGDIIALVDEDGVEVATYEYDSYGNLLSSTGTVTSPLTYRGYRYDWEIGMYYLNSRYYNPQIGRFLSSDGFLGEIGSILLTNMYAYCINNSIKYIDPSGYYLRTFSEYCRDGSASEPTPISAIDLLMYYYESPYWEFVGEDTYNDEARDNTVPFLVTVLGIILCIPTGGTSVIAGLSAVQLAGIGTGIVGIGMMVDASYSNDTSWKSVTFRFKNDPSITVTFWIEYYRKDGVDIIYTVSSIRPYGLRND